MSRNAELYFDDDSGWNEWLELNHNKSGGIYLIFYAIDHPKASMRWEEAVKVALRYGWIDSTVKSMGNGKRRQYFSPRKPGSVWSRLNKTHILKLTEEGLMHSSGIRKMEEAKADGSWYALDDVENGVVPPDLQEAFRRNPGAKANYEAFSRTYRKGYLYWLNHAKRPLTRQVRIQEIIRLCEANIKTRS
jgi:uncharacterized protein YdeI (YjbR/CyaY-like superfamily)